MKKLMLAALLFGLVPLTSSTECFKADTTVGIAAFCTQLLPGNIYAKNALSVIFAILKYWESHQTQGKEILTGYIGGTLSGYLTKEICVYAYPHLAAILKRLINCEKQATCEDALKNDVYDDDDDDDMCDETCFKPCGCCPCSCEKSTDEMDDYMDDDTDDMIDDDMDNEIDYDMDDDDDMDDELVKPIENISSTDVVVTETTDNETPNVPDVIEEEEDIEIDILPIEKTPEIK